jgi:hypothetical protein
MKRDRPIRKDPRKTGDESAGRESGMRRVRLPYSERSTAQPPNNAMEPSRTGSPVISGRPSDRLTLAPEHLGSETLEDTRRAMAVPTPAYARKHALDHRATQAKANSVLLDAARLRSLVPYARGSWDDRVSARMNDLSAFILSLVDGVSSIEAILGRAHMPNHKTLRIVHDLWSRGIIGLR